MAIDPKLVSIKTANEMPTESPKNEDFFFYYSGNILKKAPMSEINAIAKSGVKDEATQANSPTVYTPEAYPNGLFETYVVRTPLTMPNSWGFEVTQAELDANFVFFDVKNGVVSKSPSKKPTVELAEIVNPTDITEATTGKAVADYIPIIETKGNLFDKTDYIPNKYFSNVDINYRYDQIVFDAEGRYVTQKIAVKPNTVYVKNRGTIGFFDANDIIISAYGESVNETEPITSDPTAVFARFSGFIQSLDDTIFSEGTTLNNEPSSRKIDPSLLPKKGNIITISKNGGGDYKHINDAIDWLRNSGESNSNNKFTFEIIDGNYIESVNMIGLYLSLVGTNKENCIIRTYTNDYYNPPIDMAGNNHLSNLTIIADDDGNTTPPNGVGGLPAYGIHFDVAGRLEQLGSKIQGRAIVDNCRVLSKHQHAVALGLWENQDLQFHNVEMYSNERSAFRAHNYAPTAESGQKLLLNNCRMSNPRWNAGTTENPDMVNWVVMLQDPNLAGDTLDRETIFSFQNNIASVEGQQNQTGLFYRNSAPLTNTNGKTIVGHILHGVDSFGNNISELNF